MTAVSLQCKLKNHHPEWSNVSAIPVVEAPVTRSLTLHRSTILLLFAGLHIAQKAFQTRTFRWRQSVTLWPKTSASLNLNLRRVPCPASLIPLLRPQAAIVVFRKAHRNDATLKKICTGCIGNRQCDHQNYWIIKNLFGAQK